MAFFHLPTFQSGSSHLLFLLFPAKGRNLPGPIHGTCRSCAHTCMFGGAALLFSLFLVLHPFSSQRVISRGVTNGPLCQSVSARPRSRGRLVMVDLPASHLILKGDATQSAKQANGASSFSFFPLFFIYHSTGEQDAKGDGQNEGTSREKG